MRVKRYRIGTFETCVEMRDVGIEDAERAIGSIHMQPETLLSTEVGQFVEWINGTGIDCPGTAHHAKRSKAFFSISHDRFAQCRQVHFVLRIDRDDDVVHQAPAGATIS